MDDIEGVWLKSFVNGFFRVECTLLRRPDEYIEYCF